LNHQNLTATPEKCEFGSKLVAALVTLNGSRIAIRRLVAVSIRLHEPGYESL